MEHLLDNPAWNALISGNQNLANGNGQARYFDKEVSPFAALEENTADNFRLLYDILPQNVTLFVTPYKIVFPSLWTVLQYIHGLQMVHNGTFVPNEPSPNLVPLTYAHVPQMLELTKLTNPGPFAERTIDFGHYHGVFEGDKLVAMAGQRLHAFDYAEISAVCTHPEHTGKGHARSLLLHQLNRIRANGKTPFLHVRYDNSRAINVYETLGFATRIEVHFYVLKKN